MDKISTNLGLISFKNTDEQREMNSKKDNIEIIIYDKAVENIEKPFELLLNRYQIRLETLMRGSYFIFDQINLLHYKCHKINL